MLSDSITDGNASEQKPTWREEELSSVHGEELRRMEQELREYRRRKVEARLYGIICGGSSGEVKDRLRSIAAEGKRRAVVLPCFSRTARRELPAIIGVETLVGYPYGAGTKKAVLAEIKEALRCGSDVSVAVGLTSFLSGSIRGMDKTLRTIKRLGRKRRVTPMFPTEGLSRTTAAKLATISQRQGFDRIKLIASKDIGGFAECIRAFKENTGDRCAVEAVGDICTIEQAEVIFASGADAIVSAGLNALLNSPLDRVKT